MHKKLSMLESEADTQYHRCHNYAENIFRISITK